MGGFGRSVTKFGIWAVIVVWLVLQWSSSPPPPKTPLADTMPQPEVALAVTKIPLPPAPSLATPNLAIESAVLPQASAPQQPPDSSVNDAAGSAAGPLQDDVLQKDVLQTDEARGRALLTMAAVGQSPRIEVAWPPQQADQIYAVLQACLGMRVGYVSSAGLLIADQDRTDVFSPWLRITSGVPIDREQRALKELRASRLVPTDAQSVRLFPKQLDARLLAGLADLHGQPITAGSVTGRYQLKDGVLWVDQIRHDGDVMPGRIALASDLNNRCNNRRG